MRALVQRVSSASVTVDGEVIGEINQGLVVLLGIRNGDTKKQADWVADKCVNLRIFSDADGKFNLSALDIGAEVLIVSQFTLYGDCRKGRRPNFSDSAPPELSEPLYEYYVEQTRKTGLNVATGRFRAMMDVAINNDGPVTVMVEKEAE